jgi:membrane protease YdiL (CAAX protease family)
METADRSSGQNVPPKSDPPPAGTPNEPRSARPPIAVTVVTTAVVTALSYGLPDAYQATGVGLVFLGATYVLVLRRSSESVRRHGLSLGGLFESEPLSAPRVLRAFAGALGWALVVACAVLPPFWLGWVAFWKPGSPFVPAPIGSVLGDVLGQWLVIALPEECFYRGYLQSELDRVWQPRVRLLGAPLGPSLVVTSALFAAGHLATEMSVNRLAVFFPSLLFGWLRSRTRGVGASIALHAACNLFAAYLARSYGLTR